MGYRVQVRVYIQVMYDATGLQYGSYVNPLQLSVTSRSVSALCRVCGLGFRWGVLLRF
jgi:hypothetical protein